MVAQHMVSAFRVYGHPEVTLLLVGVQEAILLLASRLVGLRRFRLGQNALDVFIGVLVRLVNVQV